MRKRAIQESKFLGGDMEHTHLVKGLDFALLQKVIPCLFLANVLQFKITFRNVLCSLQCQYVIKYECV